MTKTRFVGFAAFAVALAILGTTAVVLASDLYLHRKYMNLIGLNIWGYRGPTVGRKAPGEWRLAVLGESTAFGYGVRWDEAIPAYLEADLKGAVGHTRPVTVVNLAYNNEGAHSYRYTLADYVYLHADAILFYSGYNDLGGRNTSIFRHNSAVFRVAGYMPLFPIIFNEKARAIRSGGELELNYLGKQTTFRPNITQRATATALETAVGISRSLDAQLGRRMPEAAAGNAAGDGAACGERWAFYCGEMYAAVRRALDAGTRVLVTTQPYINTSHVEQQQRLHDFLVRKFPGNARLRFANLGDSVNLKDAALCYDGMHLTAKGNRQLAAALVPHVRDLMH